MPSLIFSKLREGRDIDQVKRLIASDRCPFYRRCANTRFMRASISHMATQKYKVRAANTAICRARRSSRLRYDVQSPRATGVAVEMRFIPSEFRSLALSFSPLPLSYPLSLSRSTCGRGCASEQCIHTYAASLCAYTYTRLHTYTYNSLTFPHPSLSLSFSLYLSFSAHFCSTTAARATDNVISIYIYAPDHPGLSIRTMHDTGDTVRHFGIASRIFPPGSCLFDKVIAL